MTLLVVLGVVVIATILAALYLSLKSGRGDRPDLDDAGAGERQARGESRSGRSASLAGRMRSMADRGKAAGSSRRRFGGDDNDEYDVPDYVAARRSSSRAGGGDRSSLVTAGTGRRAPGGREAAGFDRTDPGVRAGYGHSAGYDGYDAAADTHVSGPMGGDPDTGPYDTGGYDASGYDPGTGPMPGYGSEPPRGARDRDRAGGRGRDAGGRGRDTDSPRGRYPGAAREGAGDGSYPPADRSSSAYPPAAGDFGGAAGDFGVPAARSPRGPGRPAGRRRAPEPDRSPGYDDAPTALTDSPFASAAGPDSPSEDADDSIGGSRSGRRRIARIQKPQLRLGRSRQDYDNDPWPEADEVDGVSDDQFWSDLSSDKPLATTARTAQVPGEAGQPWTPGNAPGRPGAPGGAAGPDSPGMVSAPVEADTQAMGRGRRARRRDAEPEDGTEPRPRQQPDRGPAASGGPGAPGAPGGPRRRGEPARSARGAEEDPLTSASFSRHAREASDSRSYRASRQAHRPSHGRPDASTDETQTLRPDPRGYGAPGPGGPHAPTGPSTAGSPAGRGDPYGDSGYRNGPRPAGSYPESAGGYETPTRGSRHASPPGGARPPAGGTRPPAGGTRPPAGGARPPAAGNPGHSRPALPGPAPGTPSYPDPAYPDRSSPRTGGPPAYPGGNGTSPYPGPNGSSSYPGGNGSGPYPGTYGDPAPPGGSGGAGGYRGRRSSNRDPRRPDDPYEDPYGRPDGTRY